MTAWLLTALHPRCKCHRDRVLPLTDVTAAYLAGDKSRPGMWCGGRGCLGTSDHRAILTSTYHSTT